MFKIFYLNLQISKIFELIFKNFYSIFRVFKTAQLISKMSKISQVISKTPNLPIDFQNFQNFLIYFQNVFSDFQNIPLTKQFGDNPTQKSISKATRTPRIHFWSQKTWRKIFTQYVVLPGPYLETIEFSVEYSESLRALANTQTLPVTQSSRHLTCTREKELSLPITNAESVYTVCTFSCNESRNRVENE